MTILFLRGLNRGGSLKGVAGDLYTDVITMLPRSTERVSMLFWSSVCIDSTVVPSFTKIALPYLSCGSSAIQVIPFTLGRWLCGPRCVSCKQRTLHLCLKHIFAIRSSLADDSPSMFRDITVMDGFEKSQL